MSISQTKQSITVKTTFSDNSGTEITTRESTFTHNGKGKVDSEGAKKSAKGSLDKNALITSYTNYTQSYGCNIVGVAAAYIISKNGLILTVKTSDIKPDVKIITQVFNKKQ